MLPDLGSPDQSDTAVPLPLDALQGLARELTALGWDTRVHVGPHPFVRIMRGRLTAEFVFAARFDAPSFTWSNTCREHPLNDPAGAAVRVAADLEARKAPR